MKAVLLTRHGNSATLNISEVATPQPTANQVRVKIQTIGLNYAEILSRKGLYGWAPRLPYILGMEAYGQIEALGPGVSQRRVGEPVIVGTQSGSYAEYIVAPEAQVLPAIAAYSAAENAAFAVNYMTAWVSLFKMARLQPGDRVLIQAAAGGVGTAAVQLAKAFGCTVYGAAGSDEKIERLYQLNIDHAVNYRKTDFGTELRTVTNGQGVAVVLEMVGGEVYRKSLRLLAPFGRMAAHLGYQLQDTARLLENWQELTGFVDAHQIKPVVGAVYPFDQIAAAHDLMESRQSYGKIVVQMA